jgi:hypothetical protein
MNDDIRARTDAIPDRQNTLAHYRHIEKRLHRKNRWGGRLFALAGFLFLAGGLSIGAWGNYSQQQEATAAAKQQRDFVPSLRVATIDAGPGAVSISLPARRRRSPRPMSLPVPPAISPNASSTLAITSRPGTCWRSSQYPNLMIRFHRMSRSSIS